MNHDQQSESKAPRWSLMNLVPALVAFLIGALFSAGMGWGRSTDTIEHLVTTVSRLEGAIDALSTKYTQTDKTTAEQLQQINDHLQYDDMRLDRIDKKLGN